VVPIGPIGPIGKTGFLEVLLVLSVLSISLIRSEYHKSVQPGSQNPILALMALMCSPGLFRM